MSDLALQWIDGEADVSVQAFDLLSDDGLETSIALSLFCDARASDTDVLPDPGGHRRGWWGDQFAGDAGDRTGSKLWLLWRSKRNDDTLQRARGYCNEALQWLISDGIAKQINVATSFASIAVLTGTQAKPSEYAMVMEIEIVKPDGSVALFRFEYQWQQQLAKRI